MREIGQNLVDFIQVKDLQTKLESFGKRVGFSPREN